LQVVPFFVVKIVGDAVLPIQSNSLPRDFFFLFLARQPQVGQGLLISRGFSITLNDTPQSEGLLWMSDQLVAETFQETKVVKFPIVWWMMNGHATSITCYCKLQSVFLGRWNAKFWGEIWASERGSNRTEDTAWWGVSKITGAYPGFFIGAGVGLAVWLYV